MDKTGVLRGAAGDTGHIVLCDHVDFAAVVGD